jgi:hypothetical protein
MTIAIVINGVFQRTSNEEVLEGSDGLNHRFDEPLDLRKPAGLYDYIPVTADTPAGKRIDQVSYTVDTAAGTVTEVRTYRDETAQEHNAPILTEIAEQERQQMLPRVLRDLAKKSLAEDAAANNISLDQLYAMAAQGVPAAVAYKKFKDFDDHIAALRNRLK